MSAIGALGVLFVALKLTGVIAWSWWLVTAPFWGGLALAAAFFAVMAVVMGPREVLRVITRKRAA